MTDQSSSRPSRPSRPLLALDTATPTARVALVSPEAACLARREKTAARHSANLLGLVDEVLRAVGVGVGDLRAIACGAGPGSFTGLRVGLAVAKGLALPTDLPLVLVSSLDALARDLAEAKPGADLLLPCIDAGKGQVYARPYSATGAGGVEALGDRDWVVRPAELCQLMDEVRGGSRSRRSLLGGGTGIDRYLDVFRAAFGETGVRPGLPGPSAMAVASLALARIERGDMDDIETAVPRYGRPPDITRPKRGLAAQSHQGPVDS